MQMISPVIGALALASLLTMRAYPQMATSPGSDQLPRSFSTSTKRVACQESTQTLAGEDKRKQMQLCMARARMDCLKQAVDKGLLGPDRKGFVSNCMGEASANDRHADPTSP